MGLFNIDIGGIAKSISDPIVAGIQKDASLASIQATVEKQVQDFLSKVDEGQIEINKIDAASANKFQSYWRPALAWVGVFGFAWGFVLYPIVSFTLKILEIKSDLPAINSDGLMELVMALLGMAGIREYGKVKGTTK